MHSCSLLSYNREVNVNTRLLSCKCLFFLRIKELARLSLARIDRLSIFDEGDYILRCKMFDAARKYAVPVRRARFVEDPQPWCYPSPPKNILYS